MRKEMAKRHGERMQALSALAAKDLGAEMDIEKVAEATTTMMDSAGIHPAADNGTWQPGEYVKAGFVRDYGGKTYECLQAHCTQADWTPDKTPALWAVVNTENAGTKKDPIPAAVGMIYY